MSFARYLLESMQAYHASGLIKNTWPEPEFAKCEECGREIPKDDILCEECLDEEAERRLEC